ncbi:MAG TPA: 50S ribosomal protein L4, partial [Actinomycetota bacterium]|nr:50S ribosomal protein L4 [Actinomycetota bacterium]
VADGEHVLVVIGREDETALKSFRNLGDTVDWVYVEELNTYDVLVSDRVIFTSATLGALSARGGGNG